jgi:hypothetical protein
VSRDPEAVEALHTRGTSPGGATIGWPTRREWLRRLMPAASLTCVLALLNHFPLTYPDSGNYLGNAVSIAHGREPWFFYRPLTYGVFLVPFSRAQTIWLLPLAQGLLIACVVELTLRRAGVCLPTRWFVGLFAGLSACTSLPWFSGQIMPDIFTSVVIMLSFVTLWDADQDSRWQRWSIGTLLAFAIATHLSHFAIYGVLASAGLAGRAMIDRGSRSWRVGATRVTRDGSSPRGDRPGGGTQLLLLQGARPFAKLGSIRVGPSGRRRDGAALPGARLPDSALSALLGAEIPGAEHRLVPLGTGRKPKAART